MSDVADAIAKDNQEWQNTLSTLVEDTASVLDGKVKTAVQEDKDWWNQRVIDTSLTVGNDVLRFQQGEQAEPYQASTLGVRVKDVCHMGAPATQRFNAGPPTPP